MSTYKEDADNICPGYFDLLRDNQVLEQTVKRLTEQNDRLHAEIAAKDKFVKESIDACVDAGRLRELLRLASERGDVADAENERLRELLQEARPIVVESQTFDGHTTDTPSKLIERIDTALKEKKK